MAAGRGPWPRLLAEALGHGLWPWPNAMALDLAGAQFYLFVAFVCFRLMFLFVFLAFWGSSGADNGTIVPK